MSSISVFLSCLSERPVEQFAGKMLDEQAIYGSDDRFLWTGNGIALCGNRMDLLPEDRFDRQPLWTKERTSCLIADIRLDNRDELIRHLALTDHRKLADSSILLHAWERWGSGCLDHLVGAFAFAVWTPARNELFAARDHTGERPLFYHRGKDFFALASMPAGLLALPDVPHDPDEARIVDWMSLSPASPGSSFYAHIHRVPPAHLLRVTPGRFECLPYWHPCNAPSIRFRRDSDYAEALVDVLDRATAPKLRSIGEVGTQLSAGLDSSTVAACAARLLAGDGRHLTAFTSVPLPGFSGEGSPGRIPNEAAAAAEVARFYPNLDHLLVDSSGYDLLPELEAWMAASGELPTNAVNFLWISAIFEQARRRNLRVMLQGVFGNFTISQDGRESMQTFFRHGRWGRLFRHASNLSQRGEMSFKRSFFHATNGLLPIALKRRLRPGLNLLGLDHFALHPDLVAKYKFRERMIEEAHADLPDLQVARQAAFAGYDPGPMNAAAIARYGIEPRDPLGDKRVFEFCFGIPPEQYAVGDQSRSLIRRAMRGRLPQSTLQRFARGQQGADWYLTMESSLPSLRDELELLEKSPLAQRFVDLPRLQSLLNSWPSGGYQTNEVAASWNYALTRGITLGRFLRQLD